MTQSQRQAAPVAVTQSEVQDFLFTEARLLDRWLLDDWLTLFAPNAEYLVAPAGVDDDVGPEDALYYITDDEEMMRERVIRLNKNTAYAENPHSRCRRLVSNVQIIGGSGDRIEVAANYVLYRTKFGATDVYPGHMLYTINVAGGELSIERKRVFIDVEDLYAQAKVSVII